MMNLKDYYNKLIGCRLIILTMLFTVSIILFNSCKKDVLEEEPEESETMDCEDEIIYSTNIKPIIDASCSIVGCHNSGSANGDYTAHAGVKAKVDNGSMLKRVVTDKSMPPSGPLTDEQIEMFRCWIEDGGLNK